MAKQKIDNNEIIEKEESARKGFSFWRVFDPRVEVHLTKNVSSSPILDEDGVQTKFGITLEGADEFRTKNFPYEEGEIYRAGFRNGAESFPFITKYQLPESLEDRIAVILGFSKRLEKADIPAGSLNFCPSQNAVFWFEVAWSEKGEMKLRPVSYSMNLSSSESEDRKAIGSEILALTGKRGSIFPEWYIKAKLPEVF